LFVLLLGLLLWLSYLLLSKKKRQEWFQETDTVTESHEVKTKLDCLILLVNPIISVTFLPFFNTFYSCHFTIWKPAFFRKWMKGSIIF
jgi:threonine/homoserine/homoserine lactone efflux protein